MQNTFHLDNVLLQQGVSDVIPVTFHFLNVYHVLKVSFSLCQNRQFFVYKLHLKQ